MIGVGYGRPALAAAFVWFAAAAAPAAAGAPPQAVNDAPVEFDIPAQSMAAALNSWALQAEAQVFVDPGPVANLKAPAIKGSFTPRQALRALLVHSNLQVLQGADGVFVVKPRPAVAAAPPSQPSAPTATISPPVAAAPATPPPRSARDAEGPWLLRADAEYADGTAGHPGSAAAMFGADYLLTDQVAAAASITAARAQLSSAALSIRYYFAPEQRLRPYLGAGMAVAWDHGTVGPLIQTGVDLRLSPHWMVNADVSWTHIERVQFGLGVAYRFGF